MTVYTQASQQMIVDSYRWMKSSSSDNDIYADTVRGRNAEKKR